MKSLKFILLIILSAFQAFGQYTVTDIVNPKLHEGYVANPDGIISQNDQREINQLLAHLESKDSFQIAVVAVNSIEILFQKILRQNSSNIGELVIKKKIMDY